MVKHRADKNPVGQCYEWWVGELRVEHWAGILRVEINAIGLGYTRQNAGLNEIRTKSHIIKITSALT
jgi:hypothetical protein